MTQVTAERVLDQIDDWVARLNHLYDTVDEWLADLPHDRVKRQKLRQTIEPFMRQHKIPPRDVPMYTIFRGKHRVAFVPSALWMPGANGRVNITTNVKQHILVDRGNTEHGSKWQLVVDDFNRPLVPFNKSRLVSLLEEGG